MIFLSLNDGPSGILRSQGIDVARLLGELSGREVRVVTMLPLRGFLEQRQRLWADDRRALVLPMWPRLKNWRKNGALLRFLVPLVDGRDVIARGALAANVALDLAARGHVRKVCYDGRGSLVAEQREYAVMGDGELAQAIPEIERRAVLESDVRIAVSHKLVEHWREEFGYRSSAEVVIPCTVTTDPSALRPADLESDRIRIRGQLGWASRDPVLAYAGSVGLWQSFALVDELLSSWLAGSTSRRVLFLSGNAPAVTSLQQRFPDQVARRLVAHGDVASFLHAADYGLLLREDKLTNRVAAPTKFAEYLLAGLRVLLSPGIGDYSEFVATHDCGEVVAPGVGLDAFELCALDLSERMAMVELGLQHLSKSSETIRERYRRLLAHLPD